MNMHTSLLLVYALFFIEYVFVYVFGFVTMILCSAWGDVLILTVTVFAIATSKGKTMLL